MQVARRVLALRVPMINFPRRRTDDGTPLVQLSLEALQLAAKNGAPTTMKSTASALFAGSHHPSALDTTPPRFRRKQLTEEEIELHNLGGEY
eukprot:m.445573 g.445573  ORF g.445573 m.445573 type:complete len:92 (+) comp19246_c0_seq1:1997-2272(+)